MEILFDHQTFRNQRYGGISLYISKLINGINQTDSNGAHLTIPDFENENLPTVADDTWSYRNLWRMMPTQSRRVSNVFSLYALRAKAYDVFHATYYDTYFRRGLARHKPWTFTYHDMTHEMLGHRFPGLIVGQKLVQHKNELVQHAPLIIAISELTKQDIVNHHQVDPARIRVIHHGNPYEQLVWGNESTASPVGFPYLLFVGNRWSYKNFILCLEAIAPVLIRHDVHLICAGGGPFADDEMALLARNHVTERVHYQPIRNDDLPLLYRHALAFVFPSLYEGFGLPILEAFSCGCPCVLSRAGALPEVAGAEAALYVDPDDRESMATAVEVIVTAGDAQRQRLIRAGKERLGDFSWQKTIDATMAVYQELVA